jgi:tellurite resistance protein TerC
MLDTLSDPVRQHLVTWSLFGGIIAVVLCVERIILRRTERAAKGAPLGSTVLITALGMLGAATFAGALLWLGGADGMAQATAFGTVYVVEFALSIDNLFVFLLIFNSFGIGRQEAYRVLTWGIAGAVVLRGLFIVLGASLFARFDWLFYGVGLFLMVTGVRLLGHKEEPEGEAQGSWAIKLGARLLPMAGAQSLQHSPKGAFWVREAGRLKATPLLLVLLAVEASDVVFALDSVPASFAITQQTEIIFFANMFAVLGLRCLYALLAHAAQALRYLNVALALILVLIGLKMLTRHWLEVPDGAFLMAVLGILGVSIAASVWAGEAKTSA